MSSTNRGSERIEKDAYQTPEWVIHGLLDIVHKPALAVCGAVTTEPCRGDGVIYNALLPLCWRVEWAEIKEGKDYLVGGYWSDYTITNPPYSRSMEFLELALAQSKVVLFLLPLNFLASQKRLPFWKRYPPTHLIVLPSRPSFTGDGKTDSTDYAWYGWDYTGFIQKPKGVSHMEGKPK